MSPNAKVELSSEGLTHSFEVAISRQEQLCNALEDLADRLPSQINSYAAAKLADSLLPTLRHCHHLEEQAIFPLLLNAACTAPDTIDRLRAEHLEDEDHAEILSEAIISFAKNPIPGDAERLGYYLRGLFQPLRRHTAFDRGVLLPACRDAIGD